MQANKNRGKVTLNAKTVSTHSSDTGSSSKSAPSQNSFTQQCYLETASNRLRKFIVTIDEKKLTIASSKSGRVKTRLQIDVVHPIVLEKYQREADGSDLDAAEDSTNS